MSGHHESREAWSQPIYAKIVKSKQEHEGREAGNDVINNINDDKNLPATPDNKNQTYKLFLFNCDRRAFGRVDVRMSLFHFEPVDFGIVHIFSE